MAKVLKCKPCGGSSPYWDWVGENEAYDSDSIAAPVPAVSSPLLQAILDVLDEGGEKVLTVAQKKAFQLIVREGLTYRAAAKELGIKESSLHQSMALATKKLRVLVSAKVDIPNTDSPLEIEERIASKGRNTK
jgi:hypothetical protein